SAKGKGLRLAEPMGKRRIEGIAAKKYCALVAEVFVDLIPGADTGSKAFDVHLGIVDEIGRIAPFHLAVELTAVHLARQLFMRMRIREKGRDRRLVACKEIAVELGIVLGRGAVLPESR